MKFIINITSIIFIIVLVLAGSGCSNKGDSPSPGFSKQQVAENAAGKEKDVMDNFNALLQKKDVTILEIINLIDDNIAAVSQVSASTMVIGLEKVQNEKLPKLQDKVSNSETVQKTLAKGSKSGLNDSFIGSIEYEEVKNLLLEIKNSAFKVETAEGMYFPVIDYSFYKKYRNAVTPDITSFIDIMAVESDKTPVKDASFMISWADILKRAATQEWFIKKFSNSAKVEDMRQLLKRYISFSLYGVNNTPLFSYDTEQMVPEARKTYLETTYDINNGSFSKVMSEYLNLLKKNDFKLTNEVREYRNKASEDV